MTARNAPQVADKKASPQDKLLLLLQDDRVYYDRQPIAVVIAETFEAATHAAALVRVEYVAEKAATELDQATPFKPDKIMGEDPDSQRGDPDARRWLGSGAHRPAYVMPVENHNPMEPHATTAAWQGGKLTVYDSTQGIFNVRTKLATIFGIPKEDVRVVAQFIGGGFGSKGSPWAHTALAAMAAKLVDRPVKLALARRRCSARWDSGRAPCSASRSAAMHRAGSSARSTRSLRRPRRSTSGPPRPEQSRGCSTRSRTNG